MDAVIKRFGEQVRLLRKSRGIKQQDIEERGQIASGLLSRVENGSRALALETAFRIAYALQMRLGDVLNLIDGPKLNSTFSSVGDSTLIVAGGATPKSVNELTRELETRTASRRKRSGRVGSK